MEAVPETTPTPAKRPVTPFMALALSTRKDISVIEYQSGKAFQRMVAKGFQSGEMLVALSLLYNSVLEALERQQPGLKLNTHDYMRRVFDEIAGVLDEPEEEANDEQGEPAAGVAEPA